MRFSQAWFGEAGKVRNAKVCLGLLRFGDVGKAVCVMESFVVAGFVWAGMA